MTDTHILHDAPPCPHCRKAVESFSVERPDVGWHASDLTRVAAPVDMWVNPCGHPITSYTATADGVVTELKP